MTSLEILRYNANHARVAMAELEQKLLRERIDIGIILEQYTSAIKGYTKEESGRAMLLVKYRLEYRKIVATGDSNYTSGEPLYRGSILEPK